MSHHVSKVTVHLVLRNVPVVTYSHPGDITVANWKEILADHVMSHIQKNIDQAGLKKSFRDYKIESTKYHKED